MIIALIVVAVIVALIFIISMCRAAAITDKAIEEAWKKEFLEDTITSGSAVKH